MANNTWATGQPSRYQLHDVAHFPDWRNIIVWDAYFNNLTAGFMVVVFLSAIAQPAIFEPLLPFTLTLAFAIVVFDLLLLIADLGDHFRFIHAMRVFHPTSPLSVGVVGLIFYSIMVFIAAVFAWLYFFLPEIMVLGLLMKVFGFLACIGACVVICYKGVVFSCTSQPGVKEARWLTPWMVSDSLLMGLGLLPFLCFVLDNHPAIDALTLPMAAMIIIRCITYGVLMTYVLPRAQTIYHYGGILLNYIIVFGLGVIVPLVALFIFPGPGYLGVMCAGGIGLLVGMFERYWIIGLARRI